jgi:hypothetical protein
MILRKVLSGTVLLGPEGQYFAYWRAKGLTANGETTVMAWREVGLRFGELPCSLSRD